MKSNMAEFIDKFGVMLTGIMAAFAGILASLTQKKQVDNLLPKLEAEGEQIKIETTKTLLLTATQTTRELIEQYKNLSMEALESSRDCRNRLDEVTAKLDMVIQSNFELKQINGELRLQNEELIRSNESLEKRVVDLEDIIHCLSDQIRDLGEEPRVGRRSRDHKLLDK